MKKLLFWVLLICPASVFAAQSADSQKNWHVGWSASARMAGSVGQYMPFWSRTGEDGILPVRSSGLLTAGMDVGYSHHNGIFFEAETRLAGAVAMKSSLNRAPVYGMVDRLYVSAGWRMLRMDVGMKPRHGELGDLSLTRGDFMMSGNSRNLPGINVSSDWIYFEKGHWVGIRGNLAHYRTIDHRTVKGAMIHNKAVALKLALGHKVDLVAGFDHYAQWGGAGQAQSMRDYVKVFFARRGDASDSLSDQLNVFGNHLGREWARLVWRSRPFTLTFQYDKPFEDNSGMVFQNCPDGLWTLQIALNDRKAFVTDVTYEFIYTMWQSGDRHDRPATEEEKAEQDDDDPWKGTVVLGGMDNYFNNSPYESGWTHFGRTMGLPLLTPYSPGLGTGIMNNRVSGHHLGLAGVVSRKVPYIFKATYTENRGTYSTPLPSGTWQMSLALEADIVKSVTRLPVDFSVGIYGDFGKLYPDSVGLTLRISYAGRL